ncbi:MAG: TonB-dependent receptor [Saprospiraceae bacterium]|nr:TonB-dependent receptor [Saprospiraceae bacterium]
MRIGFVVGCFMLFQPVFAQVDTILNFDSIVVLEKPLRQSEVGSKTIIYGLKESGYLPVGDVAQLAAESGLLFVKSYGLGGLATSSFRGGNASHTLVLWNGLPLASPTLGQLDFALLPLSLLEDLAIHPGGSSALWGSGAVSGTITLNNELNPTNGVVIKSEIGSFAHQSQNIRINFGNHKLRSTTRILYQSARNDFSYQPFKGSNWQLQENAKVNQKALLQSFQYSFNNNRNLDIHLWLQQTDRQIPPLLTQSVSKASQEDWSTRIQMIYKVVKSKSIDQLRFAYFDEKNNYLDPQQDLFSPNSFSTFFIDYSKDLRLASWIKISIGTTHSLTSARTPAYLNRVFDRQHAIFASTFFQVGKLELITSMRQQWAQQLVPFVPSLAFQYPIFKNLKAKGKISRDFRLPTLNDRYWIPGGNVNLAPENGWSEELGFQFENDNVTLPWEFELTGFNRRIDNWIIWTRAKNESFFSPGNITRVWSRGLETNLVFSYKLPETGYTVGTRINASWQKSTNEIAVQQPLIQAGDQLLYTPGHHGAIRIFLNLKRWNFAYTHLLVGGYKGINADIASYQLAGLDLSGKFGVFDRGVDWYFRLDNLFNKQYQIIENRAMPGRNFTGGVRIDFSKKNK